jgi:methylated-DNA-protein-cysteine methyltransferase-like protein
MVLGAAFHFQRFWLSHGASMETTTERGKKMRGPFQEVWDLVKRIPKGRVATYGQLSLMIGKKLTPVGVGWAVNSPRASIPWQRVVNGKGGISTEKLHPAVQRKLLRSEGVRFRRDGTIDLDKYGWKPRS